MRKVTFAFLTFFCLTLYSQSVEEIKANKNYISGEGWGISLKQADDAALQDLVSKISVSVQSSFSGSEEEFTTNGLTDSRTAYQSIVRTYSQATLSNTQRIVISNEPKAHVFRYVKTSDISRIFESRKHKVYDMVECANRAEQAGKIDDALRYYYWAYCLLKSLQYADEVKYEDAESKKQTLSVWIPAQINAIFSNVRAERVSQQGQDVLLRFTYKGKPVSSLDYTYFDGMDWSNLYSARDGKGVIDMRVGQSSDHIKIKCEYEYIGESHIDKEIESVLTIMNGRAFRNAYIDVDCSNKASETVYHPNAVVSKQTNVLPHSDEYIQMIEQFCNTIRNKNYSSIQKLFSTKGWDLFQKLIHYGQATIAGDVSFQLQPFGDKVICRGILMNFAFRNNNRKFVEEVTLTFNADKKIDEVSFGLGQTAYNDIMQKGAWSEDARNVLVNFLEDYKTAYALKDLDFIRNVFDDNAVIITGRVTRRPQQTLENNAYVDNKIIKYNRQTKDEYLKNLAHCFAGNEFINIRFANNDILKSGTGGETYGIQIKQDYYSSTYGDTGYLFLMIDINNPDKPIIKVRTWQPEKDPNFGIIGLSDF